MLREPLPAPPTFAQLRQHQCWLWVHCPRWECLHKAPVALAPVIIRWGQDASSDVLRERARCSRCGNKGATLQTPSWVDSQIGLAPFPTR